MALLADIQNVMRPWLGSQFVAYCYASDRIASMMQRFDCGFDDFGSLVSAMDSIIFESIHALTGGGMHLPLDNGNLVRIAVDDCALIADDLLYLAIKNVPQTPFFYEKLRSYSFSSDSLSVLRVLYERFADEQSPDELERMILTIKACHLPSRWASWLK